MYQESNLQKNVSIGNMNKALTTLRTMGLTPAAAEEVLCYESFIAIEQFRKIPQEAVSPELLKDFEEQHINDALNFTYLYMDEFGIDFSKFQSILKVLLGVYRPEELVVNPEKIRFFITEVSNRALKLLCTKGDVMKEYFSYFYEVMYSLSEEEIRKICG